MNNNEQQEKNLSILGSKVAIPSSPDQAVLECFENKHQDINYLVPFICDEFTSLCPKTGQPDWAKFEIIYVPRIQMIESKALKLYLGSFRNEGSFHEDVTNRIFKDLWQAMNPKYMRIIGDFNTRGGIAIKPMVMKYADDLGPVAPVEIQELVKNWDQSNHRTIN